MTFNSTVAISLYNKLQRFRGLRLTSFLQPPRVSLSSHAAVRVVFLLFLQEPTNSACPLPHTFTLSQEILSEPYTRLLSIFTSSHTAHIIQGLSLSSGEINAPM